MRRDEFRNLVREFLLREEADDDDPSKSADDGETSLDDQVDRLLTSYEKEAKKAKNESKDLRYLMNRFLLEAGEDEEPDEGDKEEPAAEGEEAKPEKLTSEDINIDSFAESVVRLVDNYDSLLEVRDTLIRRARDFLKETYDDATVNDFLSSLRENYDVEIGLSQYDKESEIAAPPAARAGSSPSGG